MRQPAEAAETILVIDDTPGNLAVMVAHLESHGYRVLVAQDGEEGVERAAHYRPDLILLDVAMPGLDGFAVCRRLKADARTRQIPVIFMTALSDQRDKLEGFAAGGVDYVTKPLQVDEVVARVRTHLELSALRERLARQNRMLALAQEDLERQVAARTAELRETNAALRLEIESRERIEASLRESEMRYREVLQNSSDLIFGIDVDPDGRFRFGLGNPAWEAAFGFRSADVHGREIADLVTTSRAETVYARYRECVAAGTTVDYEEALQVASETRYFHARLFAVRDRSGRIYRLLGIARDITERKRAQQEVMQHRERLEELVAARTEELQASNRELEAFSYSVSHDLRTPLRAIDGFSRMLANRYAGQLDDEGRRLIRVVRESAARMSELIDDILEFSHSGRVALRLSLVDMEQMVQEAWSELEPQRAGRSVEFVRGPLPAVRGDQRLLRQVWLNLLANAIKFTRPVPLPRIEVGAVPRDGELVYFVGDNGVGFDAAYAHKLFGVFERLHAVDEFEGTGIGLAIVKRIVGRHGGRAWAQGQPGHGATFSFSLPAAT